MKNKTVLITGAAGGLGKALCKQFGGLGANIIGIDVDRKALFQLQMDLKSAGISSKLIQCDIRSETACREAIGYGREAFGPIDILVNNAGITHIGLFHDKSAESVRRVMEVNLFGAIHCTQAVLEDLIQQKGSIVTISSVAGLAPLMGRTGYSASKFALHGFFESLRTELKDQGVHVMMVCPSTIETDMRTRTLNGGVEGQAIGKTAAPNQVADGIVHALFHKKHRLVIGPQSKMSVFVRNFMPRLYDKLMIRKVRPQLRAMRFQLECRLLGNALAE